MIGRDSTKRAGRRKIIKSLSKAIRIMELFSATEPRLSIAEISRRINVPKSTAHSILQALLAEGFIERCSGHDYALGTAVVAFTQKVRVNVEVRDRAAPHVRALADACGESVYLVVREGAYVLYIYAVESSRRLIARTAIGDRARMHCTGVGKAILGYLDETDIRVVAAEAGLRAATPHTMTDIDAVLAEAEQTRRRGYSFDRQENEVGNFCIGAAILDARGRPIGACSVAGTDSEIIGKRADQIATALTAACLDISRLIGWVPPSVASKIALGR
ncbi:MAG: IclR family transcriptional regulator [Proteobacteria bacterium]|nr:IclR family transcriptional regulator [Pseudomonadota bacterium]